MPRNELTDLSVAKRVRLFLHVDIGTVLVGVDHAIVFARILHGKVTGDERVIGPVQQAGWQAMLLAESQPVPVAGRPEIDKA